MYRTRASVAVGSIHRKSDPSVGEGLAPPACLRNRGSWFDAVCRRPPPVLYCNNSSFSSERSSPLRIRLGGFCHSTNRSVIAWFREEQAPPLRTGRFCGGWNRAWCFRKCGYSLRQLRCQLPQRGRYWLCRSDTGTIDCHIGALRLLAMTHEISRNDNQVFPQWHAYNIAYNIM